MHSPSQHYPRQIWLVLALSALGGVATFFLWVALDAMLWAPFWRQLRELGFYVHDIDTAFLLMMGPPAVAILFLIGGVLEIVLSARTEEHSSKRSLLLIAVLPALVFFIPGFPDSFWHYPLSGVGVFLVGLGLWAAYDLVERRFGA